MAVQRFDGASLFDAKDTCLYSSGRRQLLYEPRANTKRPVAVRHYYFEAFSLDASYSFGRRFVGYIGDTHSAVYNDVANGYRERNDLNPTIGLQFAF
jgi:hypothetical protein